MIRCDLCTKDGFVEYWRSTTTGSKYCTKCWDTLYNSDLTKGRKSGTFITEINSVKTSSTSHDQATLFGYTQCNSCLCWVDKVKSVGTNSYCNMCWDKLKKPLQTPATVHLRLKVGGTPITLEFFDYLMTELDADWPGVEAAEICPRCHGIEWKNPDVTPAQLKRLADMCMLKKFKIKYWGKAEKCEV